MGVCQIGSLTAGALRDFFTNMVWYGMVQYGALQCGIACQIVLYRVVVCVVCLFFACSFPSVVFRNTFRGSLF